MRKLIPPVLALALAACSLAPTYERPELPIVTQWAPIKKVGADDTVPPVLHNVTIVDWREFLPDPRLHALIEAAFENNRDMRLAIARVEEARALYGIAQAERLPTVDINAFGSAARTPGSARSTGGFVNSGKDIINRRYDVNLGVSAFELDFWGRVKNLEKAALANYLATTEAREAFRLGLITDVARAYFTLQEMEERLVLAYATLKSRAESRRLIDKRREVGLANDLDFQSADAAYETAQVALIDLEMRRAQANNALNLLVGAQPKNLPPLRPLAEQDFLRNIPIAIPSEILLHRPDVRAAEQRLIAANANVGAARAAFFPRIDLSFAYGTASSLLSGLFEKGTKAWSFSPQLTQPLFDAGNAAANTDLAQARKVIAVAEYEKTIQQAFRDLADGLETRNLLFEQLKANIAAEKAQTERLKLVEARYKAGLSNYLELLDAQRSSFIAQQETLTMRNTVLTAMAQLYTALGGATEGGATEKPPAS
ncbi:MAG: efflux transporter outer membrane subunit [Rugosibacter sp.]